MKNVNKRLCNVSKYYAWLEINKDTPVDTKLLVLDQYMFTAVLYGAETWGDITFIENKILKIEIDLLRCILKVKTGWRLSNHKRKIETGRYTKTINSKRIAYMSVL